MARNDKWIEANSREELIGQVAERALEARIRTVCRWMPEAARHGLEQIESVHQLRVSTRRAMVAAELFAPLLPKKRTRWLRKQLKRIRKTAGPARDLDVMTKRLVNDDESAARQDAALAALLDRIAEARDEAQRPIVKLRRKLRKSQFTKRAKKLLGKVRWRKCDANEPTFHAAAQDGIRSLAAELFTTEVDLHSIEVMHEMRIVAKRLRYAMEVYRDAFGQTFRQELYPLVEELQEKLGAVNDHATARAQYADWLVESDDDQRHLLERLIEQETSALESAIGALRQWWTPQRSADYKARFLAEIAPTEIRCA